MDLRTHYSALLRSGQPIPLIGRLLCSSRADGSVTLLDPTTGGELPPDAGPVFVLSTEDEATDGNIVRQEWDLSRASSVGVPVLWGHNPDALLGQWRELTVASLDAGPALVGRAYMDPHDEEAQKRRRQIKDGILNACSIGWIPGKRVRRGDLPEDDPLYKPKEEDDCGWVGEGYVMGSPDQPNRLVECSLVSTPAQVTAMVTERLHRGGERAQAALLRGDTPTPADLDRLLAIVANDPRTRAWIDARIQRAVQAVLNRGEKSPTIEDLFGGRNGS